MALRPAPIDTGIVFCRSTCPATVDIPARATLRHQHHDGHRDRAGRGARLHRRAPDVGARRARHRQRLRRRLGRGSADHGRQRRHVRVPAAVGGHRGAGGAEALRARAEDGRGVEHGDKKVRLEPFNGFKVSLHDRVRPPGVRRDAQHGGGRLRRGLVRARGRARAHLRLHAGRGDDALEGPRASAARSTTRS